MPAGAGGTFRSLRVPTYRRFLTAQLSLMCGTWMQGVAQALLVLDVSDEDAFAVGVITALGALPSLVLGAWSGVVVDRLPKQQVLMAAQALLCACSIGLAVLTWSGAATLLAIGGLVLLAGVANTFLLPAGQAFVNEMVEREELANAIALNTSVVNGSRVIGPALAGGVIWAAGLGTCFALTAVLLGLAVVLLRTIRRADLHPAEALGRGKGQVREGLRYMLAEPELRSNLLLTAVVGLFAYNFPVVLPVMAEEVFDGGAGIYSLMNVAAGVGAFFGGLAVASRARGTERQLVVAVAALALLTLGSAAAPGLPLMLVLLGVTGGCNVGVLATSNAMLQLAAAEVMRGRVLAIRGITMIGGMSLGGPITGAMTNAFGPRWGLAVGGFVFAGAAAAYGLWVRGRPALPVAGAGAAPATAEA